MMALLGVDIGTSSAKAVLTDEKGVRLADQAVPYGYASYREGAEQDANAWWRAAVDAIRSVMGGHRVVAVGVTSQAPSLVTIDRSGGPTGPALTWLDRRAFAEAVEIGNLAPHGRNGSDPFFGTAKLVWLEKHRAAVLDRTDRIVAANGFVVRRLTGVSVLDESTASLMQGFDEQVGDFEPVLRDKYRSMELLPSVVPCSHVVGSVTSAASTQTGLEVGTPVVAGAIDAVGAALEAGALAPGDPLVDMTGFSSVAIQAVPVGTRVKGYIHARHAVPGSDLLISAQVSAGASVDWLNRLHKGEDLRDDEILSTVPRPTRLTFVPSLGGERTPSWNMHARGIIDGLDLDTSPEELMVALMEGNAMALARDVRLMEERGVVVDEIRAIGGGASSNTWLQIKADVLGVNVIKPRSGHGAAHGAAILAGLGANVFQGEEPLSSVGNGDVDAIYVPDVEANASYRESIARFEELDRMNMKKGHNSAHQR